MIFSKLPTKKWIVSILFCLPPLLNLSAQEQQKVDTAKVYSISEVTITEQYNKSETRSTTPLQVLSAEKLKQLNVLQISDAIKHFSGVTVKDYGGVGGLKTVSVRSLGANHTAINYDGIVVSDIQTGQIDIGRFSLDNVAMVSLNNGQGDNIFQSARTFASGSVLNIRTQAPDFDAHKRIKGKAKIKAGSFGLINPSLNVDGKISNKLSANFSGEYLYSNGEYPYLLRYGNEVGDSTVLEKRKNTDVTNLRIESTLYGNFSERQSAYLKAYYYQSERGLPGGIIWYNLNQYTEQQTWDKTFFAQGNYKHEISTKFQMQFNAKYNWNWMRYLYLGALNSDKKDESINSQQEYYLSASFLYRAFDYLSFSFSSDGFVNTMQTEIGQPQRYSLLSVLAAKYVHERVQATASILSTVVNESIGSGERPADHRRFSPYAGVSVKPFSEQDFRIRLFYKNIFRLPSFNDLYYFRVGNRNLKPEVTDQYNIGATYNASYGTYIPLLSVTVDAYHNNVLDKIIATPNQDLASWSMVNHGKISINGLDVNADITLSFFNDVDFKLGTSYTYQRALSVDKASPRDYMHQIPYTPRISGSGKAGFESKWINVFYSLIWSGHRYSLKQNYAETRLPGYSDHSISASRDFQLSFGKFSANVEMLNLSNKNYEIVRGFPMPGRSFRATATLSF